MSRTYDAPRYRAVAQYKRKLRDTRDVRCTICDWVPPVHIAQDAWKVINVHHIIPVACGGTHDDDNLVPLCPNCHALAHRVGHRRANRYYGPQTVAELREAITDTSYFRRKLQEVANSVAIRLLNK